jgi:hypothetical protein
MTNPATCATVAFSDASSSQILVNLRKYLSDNKIYRDGESTSMTEVRPLSVTAKRG